MQSRCPLLLLLRSGDLFKRGLPCFCCLSIFPVVRVAAPSCNCHRWCSSAQHQNEQYLHCQYCSQHHLHVQFPYNDGGVGTTIRSSSSTSLSAADGSSRGRRNCTNSSSSNQHVEPSEYVKQRLGLTPPSLPHNFMGHLHPVMFNYPLR